MSNKTRAVVTRGARSLGAVVVAAVAAWLVGPDAASVIPGDVQSLVAGVLVPVLLMVDKYLRHP